MSLANALRFTRAVRVDAALRERVAALPADFDVEALRLCAPAFVFSPEELAEAFRIDWTARWAYYARRVDPDLR